MTFVFEAWGFTEEASKWNVCESKHVLEIFFDSFKID